MRTLIRTGIAIVLGLALGACASPGERAGDDLFEQRSFENPANVVVENRSSRNLRVFALIDGSELRLGTVRVNQSRTFGLPTSLPWGKEFRLLAQPFDPGRATAGVRSEPVAVRAGHEVNWRLDDRPGVLNAPIGELTVFRVRAEEEHEG